MDEQGDQTRARFARMRVQEEFFDHLLRSRESYAEKWDYVRENPTRAGLLMKADDWPWQGEIDELRL